MSAERPANILVVDDNPTNRRLLSRILSPLGFSIIEAADGIEAIQCYEKEDIDLILMDIMMPEMDGRRVATIIKALSTDIHTPIIFVTALNNEQAHAAALAAGGDDFIGKPYSQGVLLAKINAHLRIKELNRQIGDKNKRLAAYNRRLSRESQLIKEFFDRTLQQNFLDPRVIRFHLSSVSSFNGDIFLTQRSPRGSFYVLLGDFTGHGLTASMGTLSVAQIFFDMTRRSCVVCDIVREINRHLVMLLPVDIFLASILVEMHPRSKRAVVWSGGMPDGYLIGNQSRFSAIAAQHMPLGTLEDDEFDARIATYTLEPGDRLFFSTDGVIESRNDSDEMFGEARLRDTLKTRPENSVDTVLCRLRGFWGTHKQEDDISVVEILYDSLKDITKDIIDTTKPIGSEPLPLSISVELNAEDMRTRNPVPEIIDTIGHHRLIYPHKDLLLTILAEIYNNALEHGILGLNADEKNDHDAFFRYYRLRQERLATLSSGFIKVDVDIKQQRGACDVVFLLTHSGVGFNVEKLVTDDNALHGRGIPLLESLCDHVHYSDKGRRVTTNYRIESPARYHQHEKRDPALS